MPSKNLKSQCIATCVVASVTSLLLLFFLGNQSSHVLTVSFLDVGQGDSIFIETPSGRQILVDGGRDNSVLRELASEMSFWDRSIDMIVATHPDADHIRGLIDVLNRYNVTTFIHSDVIHKTPVSVALVDAAAQEISYDIIARRGQVFDFGDGVYMRVLFPDRDVTGVESNTGSVVVQIVYGEQEFLLTGDSPKMIEDYLVTLDGDELKSDVLKMGHHGSRTSSSEIFVGFVSPTYGILSRGCENSYGHPHAEVLEILKKFDIETEDTCTRGRVTFVSDGTLLKMK